QRVRAHHGRIAEVAAGDEDEREGHYQHGKEPQPGPQRLARRVDVGPDHPAERDQGDRRIDAAVGPLAHGGDQLRPQRRAGDEVRGEKERGGEDEAGHALSINQSAVRASVATVTGTPVRACCRQSMRMPRRLAASSTMMLAIEPTTSRLPASVLTSASIGPENGCVAAGSSSITAGTLDTTFESTNVVAKSGAGCASGNPASARARTAAALKPVAAKAWFTTKSPMKRISSSQSTSPSILVECSLRLIIRMPAPIRAATSRGNELNRNTTSSAAATASPFAACQASSACPGSARRSGTDAVSITGAPRSCQAMIAQETASPSSTGTNAWRR